MERNGFARFDSQAKRYNFLLLTDSMRESWQQTWSLQYVQKMVEDGQMAALTDAARQPQAQAAASGQPEAQRAAQTSSTTGAQGKRNGRVQGQPQGKGKGTGKGKGKGVPPKELTAAEKEAQQETQTIHALAVSNKKKKQTCQETLKNYQNLLRSMENDPLWQWVQKGNGVLAERWRNRVREHVIA